METDPETKELEMGLAVLFNEFLKMMEFVCDTWSFEKKQAISLMLMYFRDKAEMLTDEELVARKDCGRKKCCKTN